mmetsp:Transcript_15095/g.33281  ORF Transcript_15095/g.33281 Transcript_15095/m.33281 type:complete len:368 (-) Transcript_15095:7-1110(-)
MRSRSFFKAGDLLLNTGELLAEIRDLRRRALRSLGASEAASSSSGMGAGLSPGKICEFADASSAPSTAAPSKEDLLRDVPVAGSNTILPTAARRFHRCAKRATDKAVFATEAKELFTSSAPISLSTPRTPLECSCQFLVGCRPRTGWAGPEASLSSSSIHRGFLRCRLGDRILGLDGADSPSVLVMDPRAPDKAAERAERAGDTGTPTNRSGIALRRVVAGAGPIRGGRSSSCIWSNVRSLIPTGRHGGLPCTLGSGCFEGVTGGGSGGGSSTSAGKMFLPAGIHGISPGASWMGSRRASSGGSRGPMVFHKRSCVSRYLSRLYCSAAKRCAVLLVLLRSCFRRFSSALLIPPVVRAPPHGKKTCNS